MFVANILDPVQSSLDPTVFDNAESDAPTLKPQHLRWITNRIHNALEQAGYDNPADWLTLYLTGSLTTYQYSKSSDFDVSLFVDAVHFPEWSRAELIAVMLDHVDGHNVPGTTHPMQAYVVPQGLRPEDLYKPGLRSGYNISEGTWVVPPERNRVHDVEREMNGLYVYALEQADKMERLLQYEPDKAVKFWHQIHRRRRLDQQAGKGDYSESNIVYKFLDQRGLFDQIAETSGEHIAKISGAENSPATQNFFTDAQSGAHAPSQPLKPEHVSQDPAHQQFWSAMRPHYGPFDEHIETSIPGFRTNSLAKGTSLLGMGGGRLLDIAGSTGAFGKALSHLSGGQWQTHNLEPNPAMVEGFNKTPVPGSQIIPKAFGGAFDEFEHHKPTGDYDVVHESMGFQFISPDRQGQVAEAKAHLRPGGLFLSEQKFHTDNEAENERRKDEDFKSHYYNTEQLEKKNKEVGFQNQGPMTDNLVHHRDYENTLGQHFAHVAPYWHSGNFMGYAASDDSAMLQQYLAGHGGQRTSSWHLSYLPPQEGVESARNILGLKLPVRFMKGLNGRGGYAGVRRDPFSGQDAHHIYLTDAHSGAKNWAAWHELGHAFQYERDGVFSPTTHQSEEEYWNNPKEQEAEEIASRHADMDLWQLQPGQPNGTTQRITTRAGEAR